MAVFPLIDSPCPYKGRLSEIMEGDTCRMCRRQVHDLTSMADADRRAFLKACRGEVCVSYRVAAGTAVALTAFGVTALASPPAAAQTDPTQCFEVIVVGGVKDPSRAVLVEDDGDKLIPELPVVFEPAPKADAKPAAEAKAGDKK
jgi:predicted Fe-S protein YdhL (DUF1289 family)